MGKARIAAGVFLTGILAAGAYNVGVSNTDGRYLETKEQFTEEAKTLLKKSRYEAGSVTSFDYSPPGDVARMDIDFMRHGRKGSAHVVCSGSEVMQEKTHCRISTAMFKKKQKNFAGG